MNKTAYICLLLSIIFILMAGSEVVNLSRYDMLNQLSWVCIYLFGAFYAKHYLLRLVFMALTLLGSKELWDEIRGANDTLNQWEYILIPIALAWIYLSFIESRKAIKKARDYVKR